VISMRQVQMHVAVSTSRSLPASWICDPRLSYPSQSLHQIAFLRILEQIGLDRSQHFRGRTLSEFNQAASKGLGFYEYHTVVCTTL